MNTRCKFHYKSGLYFLNFPSNFNKKTIFTDGFENMSTWDRSANNFGHSLTALDTSKKKSGSYSGRIDDNYPKQWSKYVYSDTWIPINNSQDINFDKNPFEIAFVTNTIGFRTRASRTEYWKYWEKIETQYVTKFRKLRRE